jgi:WD40 repeat protein
MADTLRATEAGLKLIDEARRKKGWTKTETLAWWDKAHTRQATLKRFWRPKKHRIDRSAFIGICKAVDVDWTEVAELSEAQKRSLLLDSNPNAVCPYRGLSAFREKDAEFFFGRDTFINRLLAAVREKPFVAVFGLSGSGKSSIVFAGLIPKLRQEGGWLILDCRPGNRPFYQLSRQLTPYLNPNWQNISESTQRRETHKLAATLQKDTKALRNKVAEILQNNPATSHILLIIDQFEELYTNSPEDKQQPFLDCLLTAVQTPPTPLNFNIVITMRDDFLRQALAYRPLVDALHNAEVKLGPMEREELQEAIEKPAKLQRVEIEDCLTERLLDAVLKQPGLLPCLEFALTQLWDKQKNRVLNHSAYQQIGGVEKALANHADTVYAKLESEEEQQQVQRIFIQLVNFEENAKDTRRLATCSQIGNNNWHLVQYLANERLVVTGQNSATQEPTVEVVHEALIRGWDLLQKWLKENQQFRAWQERLRTAIDRWQAIEYDESGLWRGRLLLEAEEWVTQRHDEITADELKFIQASREYEDRGRKIEEERVRQIQLSEISALISESELRLGQHDRLIALLTAVKAGTKLREVAEPPDDIKQRIIDSLHQTLHGIQERNCIEGHSDGIQWVALSPDGQTIASASDDKTVKLWKLDGSLIRTFQEDNDWVYGISFSPDGQTLAFANADRTVKLWKLDGTLVQTFRGHSDMVNKVNFSPNGQMLVSASDDRTAKLWGIEGQLLRTFHHDDMVYGVTFSPDGQSIASASLDKTVKLWQLDGTLIQTFLGHSISVNNLCFSPDGKIIASASDDRTIRLWRLDGSDVQVLGENENSGRVVAVSFSPDSQSILSTHTDGIIKLWGLDGSIVQTFQGHLDRVNNALFSPCGSWIVSSGSDRTIRLWQINKSLLQHNDEARAVNFSPDGKMLVSSSDDKTIKLWQKNGTFLQTFRGHTDKVNDAIFSPDGQTIASSSTDRTIKLWQLDGTLLATIEGHGDSINNISFSPDGQCIASSSPDKTIRVWHWRKKGKLLKTFEGHSDRIWRVTFSPCGQFLASASADKTLKLWQLDGTLLQTFEGHTDRVFCVNFSPCGQMLVSTGRDRTIKLWMLDGTLIQNWTAHSDTVNHVTFSSSGKLIASASSDRTVKLWRIDGTLLQTLKGHSNKVSAVNFSPDCKIVASASRDYTVRLWQINSEEGILNLETQLDILLSKGYNWLSDYLKTNPNVSESDRVLFDRTSHQLLH